jgi:hypothetical protein
MRIWIWRASGMDRRRIVVAGVVVAVTVGVLAVIARVAIVQLLPEIPDLSGSWWCAGQSTMRDVEGKTYRERITGSMYISQQGSSVNVYVDPTGTTYYGVVGERALMAASGYSGYYGSGGYVSSILNANIRRRGAALSGEIKTISACDCHLAMSEKITFTATKSEARNR